MELCSIYLRRINQPDRETVLVHEAAHARHDIHSHELSPLWEELVDCEMESGREPGIPSPPKKFQRCHHPELIIDIHHQKYDLIEQKVLASYDLLPGLLKENVHHVTVWPKLKSLGLFVPAQYGRQHRNHTSVMEDIAETTEMFYGAQLGMKKHCDMLEKERKKDEQTLENKLALLKEYGFLDDYYSL